MTNLLGDAAVTVILPNDDCIYGVAWSSNISSMTTAVLLTLYLTVTTIVPCSFSSSTSSPVLSETTPLLRSHVRTAPTPFGATHEPHTSLNSPVANDNVQWPRRLLRRLSRSLILWAPPSLSELRPYCAFVCPCLAQYSGKIAFYALMTHTATLFGHVALATHQVVMNFYFAFSPGCDASSLAAQTFLPDFLCGEAHDRTPQQGQDESLKQTSGGSVSTGVCTGVCSGPMEHMSLEKKCNVVQRRIIAIALCMGGVVCITSYIFLQQTAHLFCQSTDVIHGIRQLSVWLACCLLFLPLVGAVEGILLAMKNLSSIASVYMTLVSAVALITIAIKRVVLHQQATSTPELNDLNIGYGDHIDKFLGLQGSSRLGKRAVDVSIVWQLMAVYQACRVAALLVCLWYAWRHRKAKTKPA
eukprot:GHVQ01003889.1.p1 GENE.GHVQ01003889.1~~GHVQ01003889.1.p1  ORF type:complete len:414 (-),score=40.15 GHVQ01003889.1:800-2041(-)